MQIDAEMKATVALARTRTTFFTCVQLECLLATSPQRVMTK